MGRFLQRVQSLQDISRVWRSGLIDPIAYARENVDIAGRLPASVHWSLFGRSEGRAPGTGPIESWLLAALDQGVLSPRAARKLRKLATAGSGNLGEAAARYGMTLSDLAFLEAMDFPDIEAAIALLPELSDTAHFTAAHRLADRHMRLDGIERASTWAADQSDLDLIDAIKLADMARALGLYDKVHGDKILNALGRMRGNATELQVFAARWPVIETSGEISAQLKEYGLISISETTEGRAGELVRAAGALAPLLNMATLHGVSSKAGYVRKGKLGKVEPSERPTDSEKIIRTRLLMPNYWTNAQRANRVTGPVFDLYYQTLSSLLDEGWTLQPVFATPIFNIANEGDDHIPTLSYHTASPGASASAFYHFKESHLPKYFSLDKAGFGGWSSLATKSLEAVTAAPGDDAADHAFHSELYKTYVRSGMSKYDQPDTQEPDRPATDYVLATLQIPDDTVNYWAYMPTRTWLDKLSVWCAHNDKALIVKRHPHDRSRLTDQLLAKLQPQPHVYVSKAPIHDLLASCDWLVTTNSGVGFEALLHLKPVIICGKADYTAAAYEARNTDDLVTHLDNFAANNFSISANSIKSFLRAYSERHTVGPNQDSLLEHIIR